jgi:hypothetical protein
MYWHFQIYGLSVVEREAEHEGLIAVEVEASKLEL